MPKAILIAVAFLLAVTAASGANAAEEKRFKRVATDTASVVGAPDGLKELLQLIWSAATADTSDAKEIRLDLLGHVDAGFTCERDFGGACEGQGPIAPALDFLASAGRVYLGGSFTEASGLPLNTMQLGSLAAWGREIDRPVTKQKGDVFCSPAMISPRGGNAITAALTGKADAFAMAQFMVAVGKQEVRLLPRKNAAAVNTVENELVLVPMNPYAIATADPAFFPDWLFVAPAQGPAGFVPSKALIASSAIAIEQLCFVERDGKWVIVSHSGAGD